MKRCLFRGISFDSLLMFRYGDSLSVLQYMDSPYRFMTSKILINHFVEEEWITQERIDDLFMVLKQIPAFEYVISNLM